MVLLYFLDWLTFQIITKILSLQYSKTNVKSSHVWTNKAGIKILTKVCHTQGTGVATMRNSSYHQWLSGHVTLTIHVSYSLSHTPVLLRLQRAQIHVGIFFHVIPPKYYSFISGAYFHGVKIALQNTNRSIFWKSCLCYALKKVHISFFRCYAWCWRLMGGHVKNNRE